jgi:sugar phosphate isomerase/epimerase
MTDSRIAICTWSLGPRGLDDLLGRLPTTNLTAVQLGLSPLLTGPVEWGGGRATVERLRATGITIVSGMMAMAGEDYSTLETIARTGGVRPDETWEMNAAHAEAVADLAAETGIDLVTFHAGFIPDEPDDPERATLIERLRIVADVFGTRGLRLGLETGQETAATLERALDELVRPNVVVNFDPANMILYGKGDPVEALARLAPRVGQVHVKDAVPTDTPGTWGTEVPVGEGAVDWPAFFDVARTIEPPVDYVIEREAGSERVADIERARCLVEHHLGRSAAAGRS